VAGADDGRGFAVDPSAGQQAPGVVARVVHRGDATSVTGEQHQLFSDFQAAQLTLHEICRSYVDPFLRHPSLGTTEGARALFICGHANCVLEQFAMRIVCLLALAALVACAHATIPGTNVTDNPQNRAVLEVLAEYKRAMEARDPNALLSLAAPDYFDRGDSSRPNEPRDLQGLRRTLPKDFNGVRALKLDIDIRKLTIQGDHAQVDYFAVMRYAVAVPNGEKWFTESDDQRMKFVRIGNEWKISSGM
jgi:hypothetical protein